MSQSNVVAFFLIAGFIVFVTVRGELTDYLGVVGLGNVLVKTTAPAVVPNVVNQSFVENQVKSSSSSSSGGIFGLIGGLFGA